METKSFAPVWHPTEAKNYFTLYNNVNRTNQIVYYDTTNAFINYPKTFYYERTNSNNNYLLTKITTNTNSDNATFGANSTSTKGNFNINKIAPNSGSSEPSIDLYCSGNINVKEYYYPTFGEGWPEELKNVVYANREGWDFTITNGYFPNSGNVNVAWSHSGSYYVGPDSYEWSGSIYTFYIAGDYISVTTNWNNSRISTQNSNGSGTLPGCNAYEANNREIPEITCKWELIIGFNRQDIPEPEWDEVSTYGSCTVKGGYRWRSEPSWSSDWIAPFTSDVSATYSSIATRRDDGSKWYYCTASDGYTSGYVNQEGIS